jgi:hypothetical protein
LHALLHVDSGNAALLHAIEQFLYSFILEDKTQIVIHCNFKLQFFKLKFFPIHAVTTWGMELKLHLFLTSGREEGQCSASHPSRFSTGERVPDNPWGRIKCLAPSGNEMTSRFLVCRLITVPNTLFRILVLKFTVKCIFCL